MGGGGGIPLPHVREIFFNYVYPDGLFWHIKRLIRLSNQWRGAGPLYPHSYASDSGVARICQRGGGGGGWGQSEAAK